MFHILEFAMLVIIQFLNGFISMYPQLFTISNGRLADRKERIVPALL